MKGAYGTNFERKPLATPPATTPSLAAGGCPPGRRSSEGRAPGWEGRSTRGGMALLGLALGQGLAAGALCGALACPPLRARGARAYRAARGALLGGPGGAAGGQAPLAGAGLLVVGAAAALLAGAAGLARAGLGLLLLGASGGGAAGARAALERDGWRAFALVLAALGAVGFGSAAYGLGELVLEAEGRAVREAPAGGVGGVLGARSLAQTARRRAHLPV